VEHKTELDSVLNGAVEEDFERCSLTTHTKKTSYVHCKQGLYKGVRVSIPSQRDGPGQSEKDASSEELRIYSVPVSRKGARLICVQ
jgi:hypothetical protein